MNWGFLILKSQMDIRLGKDMDEKRIDVLWDDNPVDITQEANFIWSIANKLRGTYMPDKYGDVIIPMTIVRRFECALEATKKAVVEKVKINPTYPEKALKSLTGYQFYNSSEYDLKELLNDSEHLADNFKSYISGFSTNVQEILKQLKLSEHIDTMDEGGCLLTVVKAFSELDLNPKTYDPIKMGYIFENLIGRFFQNVDAGQYYTGRDIIKLLVSLLISEGADDIFDDHKVITVCDQACGTGGMLSTAYSYLKHINPTADVRLFGQEFMPATHAIGLAEMLIKGQDANNFIRTDTFKEDCFEGQEMRFVIENPPFGTPWSGKDAKEGQEKAVRDEYQKALEGKESRWPAGLPSGGDSQMIFLQSAINKMDRKVGRAAIIENGGPLFSGATASGESQIRRWMLENDYIEAIVAMPTDLFYNTSIQTYVWILSMNKRPERRGKVQLIDASNIYHKLRKCLGNKKNELSPEDRKQITDLYTSFDASNELVKIYNNEDFIYREYMVMQPLQRSYGISEERIQNMISKGSLSSIYDEGKVYEYENSLEPLKDKERKKLEEFKENKPLYDEIIETLRANTSERIFLKLLDFEKHIKPILKKFETKIINKIIDGLSVMDKNAEVHKDKHGEIIYDKETKDAEIVPFTQDIDDYMKQEVLPHVPDAKWFFEENVSKGIIRTGAEIPFTRYFYKYKQPESSEALQKQFIVLENNLRGKIDNLFKK